MRATLLPGALLLLALGALAACDEPSARVATSPEAATAGPGRPSPSPVTDERAAVEATERPAVSTPTPTRPTATPAQPTAAAGTQPDWSAYEIHEIPGLLAICPGCDLARYVSLGRWSLAVIATAIDYRTVESRPSDEFDVPPPRATIHRMRVDQWISAPARGAETEFALAQAGYVDDEAKVIFQGEDDPMIVPGKQYLVFLMGPTTRDSARSSETYFWTLPTLRYPIVDGRLQVESEDSWPNAPIVKEMKGLKLTTAVERVQSALSAADYPLATE